MRYDLPASLVVFLVAIPLSLGIAVASGAPVMAGLIAAVIGGVVAGALGGARLQVSGPAAGLTVIVAGLIQQYGWAATCALTVAAGVVQIALGRLRVARLALAISPAVVHGMLAGIGVTITLAQLHVVLGGGPESSALDNLFALPSQLLNNHTPAVAIGLITFAVLLTWPRMPEKVRRVPAALVAVATGTAVAALGGWDVARIDLPDQLIGALQLPQMPEGSPLAIGGAVLTLVAVASVESLLSALAVDRLHDGPRADLDRELVGQGAANAVSGLAGGLPITGVIVRSSTNVKAGARTRASGILHGVWVLVFTLAFAPFIERIPLAVLAALLVFVGVQMVNLAHIRDLRHHREAPVYLVTLAGVVAFNLVEGVVLGMALAIVIALRRLSRCSVRTETKGGRWHVVVEGSLTFLAVPKLTAGFADIPAGAQVDLDLNVDFMDHAAFDAIHAWKAGYESRGGRVDIDEIHEEWYVPAASGNSVPAGKSLANRLPRWSMPWSTRNGSAEAARPKPGSAEQELLVGARQFEKHAAPVFRPLLARLAKEGQAPSQLFISCADSRVVPNLITASGPGDLFTVRNVGNLVSRRNVNGRKGSMGDASMAAAVEYAVRVLGVRSITVCGHSGCGAMAALLKGDAEHGELGPWLAHGKQSLERFHAEADGTRDELTRLCQANVTQQLDNLMTYPAVAEAVREGRLQLVGLYFDIEQARLEILDGESGTFAPLPAPTGSPEVRQEVGRQLEPAS